jgi:hypothetical protein
MYKNNQEHNYLSSTKKKRGISAEHRSAVLNELSHGKKAKTIVSNLRYDNKGTQGLVTIPDCKAIRNLKYSLSQQKESVFGMKYLNDIKDFIANNLISTSEEFHAKGPYYHFVILHDIGISLTLLFIPTHIALFCCNCPGEAELMVLGSISNEFLDPVTHKKLHSEAFAYSCKALLTNMERQQEGCGEKIAIISDTTFNLLTNGWCLASVGCRSLYRDRGETLHQTYRPFCYLLSRTERGDGYRLLFQCLKKALAWLGIDIQKYIVKATCSDHHDGEISASTDEFIQGNPNFNCNANYLHFVI